MVSSWVFHELRKSYSHQGFEKNSGGPILIFFRIGPFLYIAIEVNYSHVETFSRHGGITIPMRNCKPSESLRNTFLILGDAVLLHPPFQCRFRYLFYTIRFHNLHILFNQSIHGFFRLTQRSPHGVRFILIQKPRVACRLFLSKLHAPPFARPLAHPVPRAVPILLFHTVRSRRTTLRRPVFRLSAVFGG